MSYPRRVHWGLMRSVAIFGLLLLMLAPVSLADLTLGREYTFANVAAKPLRSPTRVVAGVRSFRFLGRIGGVAFGSLAEGQDGWRVHEMTYDSTRPDGQRLSVTLSGTDGATQSVVAAIHDWQMVPIARFAASDQDACFTLFGELALESEQSQEARLTRGERIVNYHDAFKNTLLGLRLFQGDILIFDRASCDLFKDDGEYLLGAGESEPDVAANTERFMELQGLMFGLQIREDKEHQSYVICDVNQKVEFGPGPDGALAITGEPFWSCWRPHPEAELLLAEIERIVDERIIRQLESEMDRDIRDDSVSVAEYNRKWSDSNVNQRYLQMYDNEVERVLEQYDEKLIDPMETYSKELTSAVRANQVNPVVYNALRNTMRYAALFRHYKARNESGYRRFVEGLSDVVLTPPVETPSVMIPRLPEPAID